MEYTIKYFEDGEEKVKTFNIHRVPNGILRRIIEIRKIAATVLDNWNKINDNMSKIAAMAKEKPDGYKKELKKIELENKELSNEITQYNTEGDDFFRKRYEIMKDILTVNGEKNEKYLSFDFWDNQVDASEMMLLIYEIANKDMPKKKLDEKLKNFTRSA